MARLSDPVTTLRGVGEAKGKLLAQLGIYTLEDLLCHFPRGYEDRRAMVAIRDLQIDTPACFQAWVVRAPQTHKVRKGLEVTKLQVADSTARLNITFFNQKFTADRLEVGQQYLFYGAISGDFSGYQMTNPVFEKPTQEPRLTRRILPKYPLTAGVTNGFLLSCVRQALLLCPPPQEVIPQDILERYDLLPAQTAYRVIHEPQSMEQVEQAKKRLIFEEFFLFSAGLSLLRAKRREKQLPAWEKLDLEPFEKLLPFALTGAQKRAMEDIRTDLSMGRPMNRLVQGDVGSGKTMVAAAALYLAWANGHQGALMAPTEILAEQHCQSLTKLFAPLGIRVRLLRGSSTPAQKRAIRERIAAGETDIVVGTHALVTDATAFADLGMVITDEQHRFGVSQRSALGAKGPNAHVLVMSATPIPRTLALILYGDLDVSVIDELPPGRQTVDTFLVGESMRARINAFIRKQVGEGHQVFVVCPAVEENEEMDLKSVEAWSDALRRRVFPDLRLLTLHGRMKGAEKEQVMTAFSQGQGDILVSTTVIEVGVDVPNATLMVVEDADRFGLSQLHQLRGRVGRGREKSFCVLFTGNRNPETLARLKAFCKTNDGFKIAQEDLALRGPGDFFGQRQSGLLVFRVASLSCDLQTLQQAQQASKEWIDSEPSRDSPQGQALRSRVNELFRRAEGTIN